MNIFSEVEKNKINYQDIISICQIKSAGSQAKDISVIVPVYGRLEFNHVLCDHFLTARNFSSSRDISVTIVEHSDSPQHKDICYEWVNYIWIPKKGMPFNKCLAHNVGALVFGNNANYLLFHDVDTLVPEDFFDKVLKNLQDNDALQTFTKRRLQHCDHWLTHEMVRGNQTIKNISAFPGHYKPAQSGAMGGSIFIKRPFFFEIGYCDLLTEYGLEDAMFWQCIHVLGKMGTCENPPIELFHLHHLPSFNRQTKKYDEELYHSFLNLSANDKKEFIKLIAGGLKINQYEAS